MSKEYEISFLFNRDDAWNSTIKIGDGEIITLGEFISEYNFLLHVIEQYDKAIGGLRSRFHDYLLETCEEDDGIAFLDAVTRGVTKQRDDWKPDVNAQSEIDEMLNEKE